MELRMSDRRQDDIPQKDDKAAGDAALSFKCFPLSKG